MPRKRAAWTLESIHAHCRQDGDCLLWTEGTASNGLPRLCVDGKQRQARTHIFCDLLGKTLESGQQVIAACGKRLCLATGCLKATSRSEAMKASAARCKAKDPLHFTRPASKFTPEERDRIRRDPGTRAEKAIRYRCSPWTIWRICKDAPPPAEPLKLPPQASSVFDFARTL